MVGAFGDISDLIWQTVGSKPEVPVREVLGPFRDLPPSLCAPPYWAATETLAGHPPGPCVCEDLFLILVQGTFKLFHLLDSCLLDSCLVSRYHGDVR